MSAFDATQVSLDRSGDLTVSLSSTLLNQKRHKTDGIPLTPALRPTPTAMVSRLQFYFPAIFFNKTALQANVGDEESIQALILQRDRLGVSRGKALTEYNAAHAAVSEFNERARLWADYSNLRELTPEEKTVFDQVGSQ